MNLSATTHIGNLPVFVGDDPLEVPRPAEIICDIEVHEVFERLSPSGEIEESPHPIAQYVTRRDFKLVGAGRLIAVFETFTPVWDAATGRVVGISFPKKNTTLL